MHWPTVFLVPPSENFALIEAFNQFEIEFWHTPIVCISTLIFVHRYTPIMLL